MRKVKFYFSLKFDALSQRFANVWVAVIFGLTGFTHVGSSVTSSSRSDCYLDSVPLWILQA